MKIVKELSTQVLVIGGGAAGTRAALAAAEEGSKVILTNKGPLARSGITLTAGGGLEAPFHPDDSPEQYFEDVVHHGYFLADQNLAWALAEDACLRVRDLERYGTRFNKNPDGSYELNKFPGFTYPRNVLFPGGGFGMMNPLKQSCLANPSIAVLEDFVVTGLVKGGRGGSGGGRPGGSDGGCASAIGGCAGALGLDMKTGNMVLIRADATVMATGGCQWIWKVNDCPADSTGDGVAMGYRAGAEIIDMEMILFYPSVIIWPPAAQGAFVHYEVLDSSFLDGEILDRNGQSVLPKPTPVRDKAMLMMLDAIDQGRGTDHGGLWWYVGGSPRPQLVKMFTNSPQYNYIRRQGIDPATDKIEVAPGAHYQLGGIFIDEDCRTTLPGFFATPECAGNHEGANRLSGTALAGTQVFGARAGISAHRWSAAGNALGATKESIEEELGRISSRVDAGAIANPESSRKAARQIIHLREALREAAQKYIAVRRHPHGIKEFLSVVAGLKQELCGVQVADVGVFNQPLVDALELESMLGVAELVAGSALVREESRGHHFRLDFPQQDDANWLKHTSVKRGPAGPEYGTRPIIATRMPLPSGK